MPPDSEPGGGALAALRVAELEPNPDGTSRIRIDASELGPSDVSYCSMPLFHVHGLVASTLPALAAGGRWWCRGAVLPPGDSGEVAVRGPGITSGYLGNPEANAESFTDGCFAPATAASSKTATCTCRDG
jgi:acyl-CoA synthetase (AMP-forming)/AMP-acid ligase II